MKKFVYTIKMGGSKMEDGIKQLVDMVANLKMTMEEGFDRLDKRLDNLENRMDSMEKRMDSMEKRMDSMEKRMDSMENRMDGLEDKMDGLEDKMDNRFDKVETKLDDFNETQEKIINSLRIMQDDIDNNKKHIDKIENKDQYMIGEQ